AISMERRRQSEHGPNTDSIKRPGLPEERHQREGETRRLQVPDMMMICRNDLETITARQQTGVPSHAFARLLPPIRVHSHEPVPEPRKFRRDKGVCGIPKLHQAAAAGGELMVGFLRRVLFGPSRRFCSGAGAGLWTLDFGDWTFEIQPIAKQFLPV